VITEPVHIEFLSPKEAAARLNLDVRTIYRGLRRGTIAGIRVNTAWVVYFVKGAPLSPEQFKAELHDALGLA
jgi:excisionase family DNA binding protein